MTAILAAVDRLARVAGGAAMILIAALAAVVFWEVIARYALNAPTMWGYDVSYMLNGVIYLLGAALALQKNLHVRIDFLSSRLPLRVQHAVNAAFYAVLFLPIFAVVSWYAAGKAWTAFATGQLEPVSPWAPKIWPFYAGIAAGLICLWLQALAETVRHLAGIVDPLRVRPPTEQDPH